MICFVYRSPIKDGYYLYLKEKDNFSILPEELLKLFGKPIFSMYVDLSQHQKLAIVDISTLQAALDDLQYYLQIPPPTTRIL